MDPLAGMDDSSDDETASQTTEDDPQLPENQIPRPTPIPVQPPVPAPAPPAPSSSRQQDVPHYVLRHTLREHTQSISAVKFSPNGRLLASCGPSLLRLVIQSRLAWKDSYFVIGAEKVVKLWSPDTGELLRNLTGHTQGLSDVAWASDSVSLASASDDTTVRIWNVETVKLFQLVSPPAELGSTGYTAGFDTKDSQRSHKMGILLEL